MGNSIVGAIQASDAETRTAQITRNLAEETQQANGQINSDFARSQQEFADQIASQFDASVSRDLDQFAAQQTARSIIGAAESSFSTPRIQALAVPQSVQTAINDATVLNLAQATEGVPFYLNPDSANTRLARGASSSWGRGASGSWGDGGFVEGLSDRIVGDVTSFLSHPLTSTANAINGALLFAYDAIEGPTAYATGGVIGDPRSVQRNSQRVDAVLDFGADFVGALTAGDGYQLGQMSAPALTAVVTEGASRLGTLGAAAKTETLAGARPQIANLRTISSSDANAPFISEKAAAEGWYPPYANGPGVRTFTTADELPFVRVHVDANNPQGGFVVRRDEIAHLNNDPQAIKTYLGLKDTPAYISDVRVPAGTRMQTGIIGPQPNFGLPSNSGIQYQLLEQIPRSSFTNTRPLGSR